MFYIDATLCIICLCFLIYFSYTTIIVFFKPDFIIEESDVLKKSSSIPDIILFFNKIIFNILFNIIENNESYQWVILFVLFIFTYVNVICLFHYSNYENKILMKLNKVLSLILFWNICCLFVGKIFKNWNFNGAFHLFFFGSLLIIFFFLYHKEKINEFYIKEFKQIDSSKEQLNYIKDFFKLINNKDRQRNKYIVFNTLILLKEENCINKNCKIKKYLQMAGKGFESDFILFQYCQQLFEMAIKKYPNDIFLKCNYIIYLVIQMSQKKLAQKVLATMKETSFNFQNNYIIFCCKKYIGLYDAGEKKNFEEKNKNIMRTIEYEKIFDIFKDNLSKAASLYYEFWSSLYKSHLQGTEDFIKLNDIGEKLNLLIELINNYFHELHNVKSDDVRVLNLYSAFIKNILNNKNKFIELKNILTSLSNVDKIQVKEVDFSNYDLKVLNKSDEFKYIIISAEEENLGIILNISLNACQVFGYNKNELIGKKITILIPAIYHKQYTQYYMQYTNKIKTKFYDLLSHKKEYYPEFLEMLVDGKNKSKYLILLYIKVFFVQTEENEHVFVINFLNEDEVLINKMNETFNIRRANYINSKESKYYNYCYVLTDCNFNIQIFTANCQELLGLNSDAINANIDITKFIEQFKEEVNKMIYEKNNNNDNDNSKYEKSDMNILHFAESFKNKSHLNATYKANCDTNQVSVEKKILLKRYIAENKYSQLQVITWKISELMKILIGNKNNNSNCSATYRSLKGKQDNNKYDKIFNHNNIFYGNTKERKFLLVVKKASLNGKHVGYKFFFKRQKLKCVENEDELKKESSYDLKYNNFSKSPKKLNVAFKLIGPDVNDNDNDNEKNNEEVNNNDKENRKTFLKMSKSLKNQKKERDIKLLIEENIDNLEENNRKVSFNSEDHNNKEFERPGSFNLKKNILKKKPSRFASLNESFSNNSNNKFFVGQNFIPVSSFSFLLDIDNMSFRPCFKKFKSEKTLNFLKNEAMNKIKQYQIMKNNLKKRKISFSSNDSSFEETESNEDEENLSSVDSSSSSISNKKEINQKKTIKKDDKIKEKEKEKNKEKTIKTEIEGNYYRVNGLHKIKFMIYDFDQEMVIDKGMKKELKSEVENIIINYKLKIPTGMDKDTSDPSIKINKILSKYSNTELKKEKTSLKNTNIDLISQKKNYKEQEMNKRIENALVKNDEEKAITRLFIFIIICSFLYLSATGYILYYILSTITIIKNNLLLIIYSTNIRHYTNMGIYYIREMSVLAIGNPSNSDNIYINFPNTENRTFYIEDITEKLKEVFFLGHSYIESMMEINLDLNNNNTYHLNTKPFNTKIKFDKFKLRNVTSTLTISLIQIYSFFYNLILYQDFSYNNEEVYNFMYNSINNVGIGIEDLVKIYLSEIKIRKDYYIIVSIVLLCISFIFEIIIYIISNIIYIGIIHRKESYISIFYCINLSFIKASMLKCEQFVNKLNPNELLINSEQNNELNDDSISFSNLDDEYILHKKVNKKNNNKNKKLNNRKEKKIKYKEISNMRVFKIKLIAILLISFSIVVMIIWNFIDMVIEAEIMSFYIYHMQHYHNNLLNLLNAYREFLFDNETQMHNLLIPEYLGIAEKEIYLTFTSDLNYIGENSNKISGLNKLFKEIQQNNLCAQNTDGKMSSVNMCDNYLEVITSLGFFNFLCFWVEEIRIKKNYILLLEEENNINNINNINDNRIVEYFNMKEIHPDINFMFSHVILPYINEERNLTMKTIINNMNKKSNIYIILFLIYCGFDLLGFMFFWRPIINNTKSIIYKTKYMLTIIPVDALASQTNIKNLLGISDLNE